MMLVVDELCTERRLRGVRPGCRVVIGAPNPHDTDVFGRVSRVHLGGAQPVCAPTKKGPPDGDTDREDEREQVSQLGGQPNFNPGTLAKRSHTEYVTVDEADLTRMLQENLVAERIVITSYQEIIRWIGDADPTTRRLMEKILEQEEEHADDLNDLLGN